MSLGGPNSLLVATEVDHIKAAGRVLVVEAGSNNTTSTSSAFPGADPDTALRVTATEENDCRYRFSNFSPAAIPTQYNIAAPGFNIYSTTPNEGFALNSGTSMASPIVAGAAALVWGQLPALTRDQLTARVVGTGKAINCGFAAITRRLDVRKAILGTVETALVGRILDPFTGTSPNPNTTPTNARLFSGATQLAVDGTNRGGSYEMTGLSPGARVLRGERAGYVNTALRVITTVGSLVVGPSTDALPQARPVGHATVTLDWKTTQPDQNTPGCVSACNGWDFDLAVKLPTGIYIDPFINTGDLIASPFVKNPRDSAEDSEPVETAVIGAAASNGVYRVVIDRQHDPVGGIFNPSWIGSQASVQLYNGATPIGFFYGAPPASCTAATKYWYVGNLTKTGTSYVDECECLYECKTLGVSATTWTQSGISFSWIAPCPIQATDFQQIDLFRCLDENEVANKNRTRSVAMKMCYQCQREVLIKDRVGRRDTCLGCGADLCCCLNCVFYDTRYANACREPQTDPVLDKEAGNFCDFFAFAERQGQSSSFPETAPTSVRAQLEGLFKKKS